MGYIKEPLGIDFVVESKEWTEQEKEEMRKIMNRKKSAKNKANGLHKSRISV